MEFKMKENGKENTLINSKYVVYRDDYYQTNWIDYKISDEIVKYLTDKKQRMIFKEMNADELKNWMKKIVDKKNAKEHVVVFSQDVIPDTIFFDKSDNLMREYLHLGGRVVWIGDIPFYNIGEKVIEPSKYIYQLKPKLIRPGAANNTYAMFGSFPAYAFSESKVILTKEGKIRGLAHQWYSIRPVHPRYIPPWFSLFKRKHILAETILTHPINEKDINPQKIKSEEGGMFSSVKSATEFFHTFFSLPTVLLGFFILLFGSIITGILNIPLDERAKWIFLIVIIMLIIWIVKRTVRKKYFSSAWIKDFKNGGEFIRIWDFKPETISELMLKDLYNVATNYLEKKNNNKT